MMKRICDICKEDITNKDYVRCSMKKYTGDGIPTIKNFYREQEACNVCAEDIKNAIEGLKK